MNLDHVVDRVESLDLADDRYALIEVSRPITKEQADKLRDQLVKAVGEDKRERILILSEYIRIWGVTEMELSNILAVRTGANLET